jgi:hypothetical protein
MDRCSSSKKLSNNNNNKKPDENRPLVNKNTIKRVEKITE